MKRLVRAAVFGALSFASAHGQSGSEQLTGSVVDPAGLALAGAHVDVDTAAGHHLSTVTGPDGRFTLALPPTAATPCT